MTHSIHCKVSNSLWRAIEERQRLTGESLQHIVRQALADYLQVEHSTLFQISTTGALVEGLHQGEVTVGLLRQHGDFGLGTFNDLDGEMVVVDGCFYQVRSDGKVYAVTDEVRSPFAVVTHFVPERTHDLTDCPDLATLLAKLDQLRLSENVFFAIRVEGNFDYVRTRAVAKQEEGVRLVEAAATQPEFEFHSVSGTLVGFWTPESVKAVNVPGYHLHFLTADKQAGGHLLECAATQVRVQIQHEGDFRMSLPETEAFLKADFSRDTSTELLQAEK
ncbi:MAG: acetolactate decarboxylase [Chroococcidiopsidaceae cyanobacterium CP_BM_ER_R8_30]|nr:acetolactate decarboxylase [Chroococcidiopsidaceae cyanobacterium CP_BM_ER_R8_30]